MAVLAACTSAPPPVASLPPPVPAASGPRTLRVFNWPTYIDPQILSDFEQQYGVRVDYQTYGSNDELLATVTSGSRHDVVVPSDYMLERLRHEGLLAPLHLAAMPNLTNLDPLFVSPVFDPGNRYCVAYQWGTVGIGYNIKATGREIHSWHDLFDPAFAGRVALLDDARVMLGAMLLAQGISPNSTREAEVSAAADLLRRHENQIAIYLADSGQDALAAGEVDLVVEYNGDILRLMEQNPDIRFVLPDEGSIIWTDSMCVLASSTEGDLAEQFINYMLDAQVGARLSSYVRFSSPNRASLAYLPASDQANPVLYPSAELRRRLFFLVDVGRAGASYDGAWQQVLSSHAH